MNVKKLIAVAAVAASAMASPSWAATNITENVTLTEDTDWREHGHVTIASGVTVALNGYKLYTAGVTGGGTVLNQFGMYSHYRFKVEAIGSGTTLAFTELCFYSYGVDVTSQRSGASASYGGGRTSSSEAYDKALDGIIGNKPVNGINNKLCVTSISNFNTLWVQVDYAEPIMISKYEWYSTSDGAQQDRAPTKWRFQGSNDGTNWTDIDVVERAYGDNPSTSGTLAYTYDNGLAEAPGRGEFHVDVPQGETNENAVALDGNIKFFKDGAGTLTETRSTQTHKGGDEITAGAMAYSAANYVLPSDLTLAGGTLAITDGNSLTVSGAMSVTSPSIVKCISDNPFGRKLLITGAGTGFAIGDLTLVTEPAITGAGTLSVDDGNLYASFGAADDVVLARWTGAVDGDVSKSGNWNCYNALGTLLSDKLPSALTDVRIEGDVNIQMPVGATIAYDQFTIGDCTLTTNCDWRGLCGPISGTVKPDGHRLILTDFLGTGTIQGNSGGYAHYRFKVEAIGKASAKCLAISDLRLYSYDDNVTTQRSGASGSYGGGGPSSGQTFANALDNDVNNKLCVTGISNFNTLWVQVDYAKPILITKYEWYSTNDGAQRDRAPTKWRFQGSDDGTNWVDIDVVERAYEDNPETSKTLAYTGYVTPAPSVLQVDVANGLTKTNSTLALSGYLKVEKTGAGTFVANKAGQTNFGDTEVKEGTLKPGVNSAGVFGKGGDTLAVADGAQILDNLAAHDAFARHYLQLAGEGPDGTGAYRVTTYRGSAYSLAWTRGLTVTNDTLFGRDDYGFGLVAPNAVALPLTLNGKTLTFKSSNGTGQNETHLPFRNVQGDGPGTLVISDYVRLYPKNEASTLSDVTLVIDTLGQYLSANDESSITVSNLVYRSNTQVSRSYHAITVLGSYAPESSTYAPMVQLGDETHLSPTLDLSGWAGTFNKAFGGGLTFAEGATVSVKVGSRKIPRRVIGWTEGTGPANVNFVLADAIGRLTVESDGVYRQTGFMIIVK